MTKSLFIVDIASCTGCGTCSIACKDRAGIPDDLDLLRVEAHEAGVYPEPTLYYRVIHCFHCDHPACAEACPVEAISKGEDRLVMINAEECVGCGNCIEACPFGAIVMLPEEVAAKCDGCADEIAREWNPTCVRACPMRALKFQSINEIKPDNRLKDPNFRDYDMEPAVLYLLRDRRGSDT